MDKYLVFVYGTLMSNYSNSSLLKYSKKIGRGSTIENFTMYCSVIPFVVECPSDETGYKIKGELYEVDEDTLKRLDKLEHHPSFYERKLVRVIIDENSFYATHHSAWMYFFPFIDSNMKRCTEGDYRNYIEDYYFGGISEKYISCRI